MECNLTSLQPPPRATRLLPSHTRACSLFLFRIRGIGLGREILVLLTPWLHQPLGEEPLSVADVVLEVGGRHVLPPLTSEAKVPPADWRVGELIVRRGKPDPDLQNLLVQPLVSELLVLEELGHAAVLQILVHELLLPAQPNGAVATAGDEVNGQDDVPVDLRIDRAPRRRRRATKNGVSLGENGWRSGHMSLNGIGSKQPASRG